MKKKKVLSKFTSIFPFIKYNVDTRKFNPTVRVSSLLRASLTTGYLMMSFGDAYGKIKKILEQNSRLMIKKSDEKKKRSVQTFIYKRWKNINISSVAFGKENITY